LIIIETIAKADAFAASDWLGGHVHALQVVRGALL